MPTRPEDFLAAAKEIQAKKPVSADESRARTVVARGYYAAYHATREAIRKELGDPRWNIQHWPLASALKGATDPAVKEVGELLNELRELRARSDYKLDRTVTCLESSLRLKDVETVLERVPKISSKLKRLFSTS
jgi:uncharacterized protein (UPF0332 family)